MSVGPVISASVAPWAMVIGVVAGALVMVGSLVLIRAGRAGRRATPTRLTAGVCGLIIGYHVMAWSMPQGWLALRVPLSRWWAVALVTVAAVGGSLLADRLDGRVTRV